MSRLPKIVVLSALCAVLAGVLAACGPDAPPSVYRGAECDLAPQIMEAWAGTGDEHWAVDTAIRESKCDPCAYYPSQSNCDADPRTAKGVFQLLGHDGMLHDACPLHPRPWSIAYCNITAARWLYDGSGRRPWGG